MKTRTSTTETVTIAGESHEVTINIEIEGEGDVTRLAHILRDETELLVGGLNWLDRETFDLLYETMTTGDGPWWDTEAGGEITE